MSKPRLYKVEKIIKDAGFKLNELKPEDHKELKKTFSGDRGKYIETWANFNTQWDIELYGFESSYLPKTILIWEESHLDKLKKYIDEN